jgi:hypothetical protein
LEAPIYQVGCFFVDVAQKERDKLFFNDKRLSNFLAGNSGAVESFDFRKGALHLNGNLADRITACPFKKPDRLFVGPNTQVLSTL